MSTEEVVAAQLAENTGIAMMDSGGQHGRAWQQNQSKAQAEGLSISEMFAKQPAVWWDGHWVTLSTYHWMVERLDHRADLQKRYDRWVNLSWVGLDRYERGRETNHPQTVDDYIDAMIEHGWMEEHSEFASWTNTYNHESLLSQNLQFRCATYASNGPGWSTDVVFMSTHNGADARGGYSDFKIYECDPWEMFDWDGFSAHCQRCESHPDDPSDTLFDNAPYVPESHGYWWHGGGGWDTDVPDTHGLSPIFDPRWELTDGRELPDDFDQTGPICPIHLTNMEIS